MKTKRFLSALFCAAFLLALLPQTARAGGTYGGLVVAGGAEDSDYSYDAGTKTLTIVTGTALRVSGSTANEKIAVAAGVAANITLDGVSIDQSAAGGCAFYITGAATVSLTLTGANALTSGGNYAGLRVPAGAALTIGGAGTLTAIGGLYSADGCGAGIGGFQGESGGNVTVNGGVITAVGGRFAAGIGSGGNADNTGDIAVAGGTVIAYGGINVLTSPISAGSTGFGAGIGAGHNGNNSGAVHISGGRVEAYGGILGGAGIGGGAGHPNGCNSYGSVIISGGTVTATGGAGNGGIGAAAGIGGGGSNYGGDAGGSSYGAVVISGGTVTATGGTGNDGTGAGIGGGAGGRNYVGGSGGPLYITGGSVGISAAGNAATDGDAAIPQVSATDSTAVYLTTVTLSGAANADVGFVAAALSGSPYAYGVTGMKTDTNGKLYLWLPVGTSTAAARTTDGGATPTMETYAGAAISTDASGTAGASASPFTKKAFAVTGDPAKYTYGADGALIFTQSGTYTVSMDTPGAATTADRIVVNASASPANITLSGVAINRSAGGCAFDMAGASVNLTLAGENNLTSGTNNAGLNCPPGATLTIGGTGSLAVSASVRSAGIGAGSTTGAGGTVTITGGTVTASGTYGIGGGISGTPGTTVITGGSVKVGSIMDTPTNGPTHGNQSVSLTELSGMPAGIPVTSLTIPAAPYYGITDMYTDGTGKLYLWLPSGASVMQLRTATTIYNNVSGVLTADAALPAVTGVTPSGAGASLSGNIEVTFDEEMRDGMGTVSLAGAAPLAGGHWNAGKTVYTVPYSGLAHGTAYTVFISGFQDYSGNTMRDDDGHSFITAASSGGGSATPSYSADVSGGGSISVTVNKTSGNASVTVGDALGAGIRNGGNVTVTMPSIPGVTSYTLGIPVAYLSTPGGGTLTFNTDTGSMTLPADMLSGIAGAEGKKAEITIGAGDTSALSGEAKAAIGNRPLISLSLTLDGMQTEWNSPGAPVTVSIPYKPTTEELQNPDAVVIWYLDGDGSLSCVTNGRYDAATGTVTFSTVHFSLYAVGYNPVSFGDVAEGAWYCSAVSFIAARGIAGGRGGGNFGPDAKLTRADFLVMLMKAYGITPDENPVDNFADAGSTYYTGYLAAAKHLGITTGTGNNQYAPGKEITRQDMFTLLYNALKVIGRLPQGNSGKKLSDFIDSGSIAAYAQEAMTYLVETGTVSGSDGKVDPAGGSTRAQMAQVLYSLLKK